MMGAEKEGLFVVAWKSKATGISGHGKPLSLAECQAHVKMQKRKRPELEHFVVSAESVDSLEDGAEVA
jgi:hypothetical protein